MSTFNLSEAIASVLELMRLECVSPKKYISYKSTGFGNILKYFKQRNMMDITQDALDYFISDQYDHFRNGEFCAWKWQIMRRCAELLKHYISFGNIALPNLRPLNAFTRRSRQSIDKDIPTDEQLHNPKDIFSLVWRTHQAMLTSGLTVGTIRHYTKEGLALILRYHYENGCNEYSESIASQLVYQYRYKYENGNISRVSYQNLRKASWFLSEMYNTGNITLSRVPKWGMRQLQPVFADALQGFCKAVTEDGHLASSSISVATSAIRVFLFDLEDNGFTSFESITLKDISDTMTQYAKRYTGGLGSAMYSVRIFFRHLYNHGITGMNFEIAIPKFFAPRKRFHEGFSRDEIHKLLDSVDKDTPIGIRDYAIMLTAAQTGLRACDIVNLKYDDIDWRNNQIRIIQHKTSKALTLPLAAEFGNAIAEYLLDARPESDLPYIFLCHSGKKRPMKSRSASGMVTKYLKRLNIPSDDSRKGFHSFRRAVGTNMLQSGTPVDILQQVLGQTCVDSVKPYLSIDEQGLKECALSLAIAGAGDAV